jgi:hypothetical protein
MDQAAVIHLPVFAVPDNPFFPGRDIPNVFTVFSEKAEGVSGIGKLEQPLLQLFHP